MCVIMAQTLTQRCVHIFVICIHTILLRPNETYIASNSIKINYN